MKISNLPEKTFKEHVVELRKFVIISVISFFAIFGLCFYFASNLYQILAKSLTLTLSKYSLSNDFIVTSVTEVFSTYLGLAFYASLILFFPIFLVFAYIYLLPVFSKKEKKVSMMLLFLTPTLFFLGASFTYFVAFGVVWDFFIKISMNSNIILLPKLSEYISLSLSMMFAFGFAFELPVLLIVLSLFNLIDEKSIIRFGKYAIVLAFVLGAMLTPPDPISQITVATILILLYYISYFIIKIISKLEED